MVVVRAGRFRDKPTKNGHRRQRQEVCLSYQRLVGCDDQFGVRVVLFWGMVWHLPTVSREPQSCFVVAQRSSSRVGHCRRENEGNRL